MLGLDVLDIRLIRMIPVMVTRLSKILQPVEKKPSIRSFPVYHMLCRQTSTLHVGTEKERPEAPGNIPRGLQKYRLLWGFPLSI